MRIKFLIILMATLNKWAQKAGEWMELAVWRWRMPPWGLVCPMSARDSGTWNWRLRDQKSGLAQNLQRVGISGPVGHAISSMELWNSGTLELWRCHNKSQSRQVVEVKDADASNRGLRIGDCGLRIEAGETSSSLSPLWNPFGTPLDPL